MRRQLPVLLLALLLTACAGTQVPEEMPEPGVQVHTDWSHLGERAEPLPTVGGRWYADYTDRLIPRKDYGMLIPYAGLRLQDHWPAMDGCLYGLMTRDGRVVTDPVYSRASRPGGMDAAGQRQLHPLLVLTRGEAADQQETVQVQYAVAAADGSWCTPFSYIEVSSDLQGLILYREDAFTLMAPDGTEGRTWTLTEAGISPETYQSMLTDLYWGEGIGGQRSGDYLALEWVPDSDASKIRCFHLVTGAAETLTWEAWEGLWGNISYPEPEEPAVPGAQRLTDSLLGEDAPGLLELWEFPENGTAVRTYYRQDGTPLPQFTLYGSREYQSVSVVGGLIQVLDWNTASYYDLDTLECCFRTYLGYEGD